MSIANAKDQRLKRIWYLCNSIYVLSVLYAVYRNITHANGGAQGMLVVAVLTPCIVPLVFRLLRFQPVYEMYIVSTIFMYFASLLGNGFSWYQYRGFDKALHFCSGLFVLTLAIILFFCIRKSNQVEKRDRLLFLIFINAVNMATALLWEFYEYAILIFFQNDAIRQYSQGVRDSMNDMLCATIAGLLLTLLIVRYLMYGRGNFFTNIFEKFYQKNIAH